VNSAIPVKRKASQESVKKDKKRKVEDATELHAGPSKSRVDLNGFIGSTAKPNPTIPRASVLPPPVAISSAMRSPPPDPPKSLPPPLPKAKTAKPEDIAFIKKKKVGSNKEFDQRLTGSRRSLSPLPPPTIQLMAVLL